MMIQISTGFLLKPLKENGNRILCEYVISNNLYSKGRQGWFYKQDLRVANIFDYIEE